MRVRVAKPVMVQDLEQFGFFECGDCLARLVTSFQGALR